MAQRIHVFGAPGSGTTTLGGAISNELQIPHLDVDSYYWKRTDPPFLETTEPGVRLQSIERDTVGLDSWVLSGSVCGWGEPLIGQFTLAVFLYLDSTLRMMRPGKRERRRWGARIEPRGDMHNLHRDFISWAESYDTASAPVRSLDLHEKWMQRLDCPVIRLDAAVPVRALIEQVMMRETA